MTSTLAHARYREDLRVVTPTEVLTSSAFPPVLLSPGSASSTRPRLPNPLNRTPMIALDAVRHDAVRCFT